MKQKEWEMRCKNAEDGVQRTPGDVKNGPKMLTRKRKSEWEKGNEKVRVTGVLVEERQQNGWNSERQGSQMAQAWSGTAVLRVTRVQEEWMQVWGQEQQ